MDKLCVKGLVAKTTLGIHEWEQQAPRQVVINLEIAIDAKAAAATDSVDDAIDYSAVCARLISYLEAAKTGLIETLAERLAAILLDEFKITWLRLELLKPKGIPEIDAVGVVIERGVSSA